MNNVSSLRTDIRKSSSLISSFNFKLLYKYIVNLYQITKCLHAQCDTRMVPISVPFSKNFGYESAFQVLLAGRVLCAAVVLLTTLCTILGAKGEVSHTQPYSFMQARSSAAPIRITRHVGHSVLSTSVKRTMVDSYSHRLFVILNEAHN